MTEGTIPESIGATMRSTGILVVVMIAAIATGLIIPLVPIQPVLLTAAIAVVTLVGKPQIWICVAIAVGPVLGLVRRLLAGELGKVDFDPLIMLPLLLGTMAVIVGMTRLPQLVSIGWGAFAVLGIVIGVIVSIGAHGTPTIPQLFVGLQHLIPLLIMLLIAVRGLPDYGEDAARWIVAVGIIAGLYGIYQFVVLPSWDRRWMIASELTSIGAPLRFQVRVFGGSESPGPYAVFIGAASVISYCWATQGTSRKRALYYAISIALIGPLILSGTRSTIVGVLATIVLVSALGLNFGKKLAVIPLVISALAGIAWVVQRFGQNSFVLRSERFTEFDVATDVSAQARLNLFESIPEYLTYPFGSLGESRVDNVVVDILATYGIVPAIMFAAVLMAVFLGAIKNLVQKRAIVVSSVAIYLWINLWFGNYFASSIGLMMAVFFGGILVMPDRKNPSSDKIL